MPKVQITLDKKGGIKADAIDFDGQDCMDATKFLDELFDDAETTEHKLEYYNTSLNKDKLTSGHCG